MSDETTLSSADVAKLLQDPNSDNRAAAAQKVASTFGGENLSDSERAIAEDIFRAMLKDAAVRVREALSDSLKDNPAVPHDVAASLAKDVESVAMPMITSSDVLTDEDLVDIVKTRSEDVQKAVAGRANVSERVADALVDSDNEDVVATLVGNEGANLNEGTFDRVLDKFGDSEKVNAPMAHRSDLPVGVSERLVTMVSEQLREHIMTHHEISPTTAADLLLESREKATVSLVEGGSMQTVQELVDELAKNKRLTPTLMLRALCMGDTTFFEVALAKKADIPVLNAYKLVHDGGDLGLKRLFEVTNMPPQFLTMARAALDISEEMVETGGDDRDTYRKLMIERVLTQIEDDIDTENLDYLIGKLGSAHASSAPVA
ncbi:MAG: DUF2336 domain-containing protein [Kordiimonadaceae bacterium]|nr:DUF2336 domain-containing protein [Kordiimonadaceae bacterium]MBO6570641.1 DUF2336 domain-containing protein [Kordiimonadaceae bacterium]MBO6966501.1 DUF2336 domain-containing protein [Kordiimonadaceae bacterium]